MKYKQVTEGIFLERPNRFIAYVDIDGVREKVHVKNTGRCKELLVPGNRVYLSAAENTNRKTGFDLIAVEKQRENAPALLINMDSQITNSAAEEWLRRGELFSFGAVIRREVRYRNSRFDFFVTDGERKAFLEVKSVTLEENGTAMFPDAPTERGIKHIHELMQSLKDGYEAYILFVIQMKEIEVFRPNNRTHAAFGEALCEAEKAGVRIMAVDCTVTPDSIEPGQAVTVQLD